MAEPGGAASLDRSSLVSRERAFSSPVSGRDAAVPASHRRWIAIGHALSVAFVALSGLASLLWGERIPVSEGLGWDGSNYGRFARDFFGEVFVRGVDPYLLQRVLPSGIVHYGLRLFGAPTDNPHVILGFQIYNLLLLTLCAALWKPIADRLQLGWRGRAIGFIGLFLNYATLKHAPYLPVFTDVTAFTIGQLALYLFLAGRQGALCALAVAGAFAWPSTVPALAPLLLFPYGRIAGPDRARSKLSWAVALSLAAVLALAFLYMYAVRDIRKVGYGPTIPVVDSLVVVSLAIYVWHITVSTLGLTGGVTWAWIARAARAIRPRDVALVAIALLVPKVIMAILPHGPQGTLDLRAFARFLVFLPNTRPYVFMVSHVVYFGPVLLLLYFLWRPVCERVRAMGPGAMAFMLIAMIFALTSESRQSNLALPFVVAVLASVTDATRLRPRTVAFLAVVGLVSSKVWLDINGTNTGYDPVREGGLRFGSYFLSDGPWMTNYWYAVQGAAVLLTAAILYLLLRADTLHARRAAAGRGSTFTDR